MFRFNIPKRGRFQLNAIPYNVGTGNAGSNLDLQITLYNGSQTLLNIYNPGALLNSIADTLLNPGNYYLKAEGKGNVYAPSYASLGCYSLNASIITAIRLQLPKLRLNGLQNPDKHQFNWIIEGDEEMVQQILEVSVDENDFIELSQNIINTRSYIYRPVFTTNIQYRLKAISVDGHRYFSNIVTLKKNEDDPRPILLGNLIRSNTVTVSSPGNNNYSIIDINSEIINQVI